MPAIELDSDVIAYLLDVTRTTGEPPSSFLRRTHELAVPDTTAASVPAPTDSSTTPNSPTHDLVAFLESARFRIANRTATDKFLAVLGFLATQTGERFERILEVSGRGRRYFAQSRDEITQSGRSLHPQQIPGTSYWVMTNASTTHKREIMRRVLAILGYNTVTVWQVARAIA